MASFAPFDMEAQGGYPQFQGISEKQMRLGFIRKVYGIVACQVMATAVTAALCAGPLRPTIVGFVVHWPSTFKWGSLLATGLALLICHVGKNSYPVNFLGLGFLTAVMSLDVGVMAAVASAMGTLAGQRREKGPTTGSDRTYNVDSAALAETQKITIHES
eukprot:s257_g15.t1